MEGSSRESKQKEAQKKGAVAAATAVGTVAAAVAGVPVLPVVGLGVSAWLGYRWIKYRIDNSIRF